MKSLKALAEVIQGKWNAKQLKVICWLANPKGFSQKEVSEELSIDQDTICNWKRLPGFMDDVRRVSDTYFIEQDLEIDHTVFNEARKGNIKAAELYYKRRGLLTNKIETSGGISITITPWEDFNEPVLREEPDTLQLSEGDSTEQEPV